MCWGKLDKLAGIVSKSVVKRIISSTLLKVKEHSLKLAVKYWSEGIVHAGKFVYELEQNHLGYFRIIVTCIFSKNTSPRWGIHT